MPHISKKKVKRDLFEMMHDHFVQLMTLPREAKRARAFLGDVLTPTEQRMIAKRLAVIVMLCRGYSGYKIRAALKVSPSTTTRLSAQLESGMFPYLEELFRGTRSARREKEADSFWNALHKILLMGMPPIVGRGRWKFLFAEKR